MYPENYPGVGRRTRNRLNGGTPLPNTLYPPLRSPCKCTVRRLDPLKRSTNLIMSNHYDIIFAGAGLSALSIATQMVDLPFFQTKKILLTDRDQKDKNDRTWCFWATNEEVNQLPPVLYKTWKNCHFHSPIHSEQLQIKPYQYHMVRGIDFYNWAKTKLSQHSNVHWEFGNITDMNVQTGSLQLNGKTFQSSWILNSAITPIQLLPSPLTPKFQNPFTQPNDPPSSQHLSLLQHFKGWVIKCPTPIFNPDCVTFMDFRVAQKDNTRFVYVLPFSQTEALVEYTVFSPQLLSEQEYDTELTNYIHQFLQTADFQILDQEFGVIPMTDFNFPTTQSNHVINIGTSGGFVKGSTGYAFKRTQQRSAAFVKDWAKNSTPNLSLIQSSKKYRIYDSVFLRALSDELVPAHLIFGSFFKNLGGTAVFRFLDENTHLLQDLKALNAVPTLPFIKAAYRQLNRLYYV